MERNDPPAGLGFDGLLRWPLSVRILAVNVFALILLAGGFFYLDSFRVRTLDQRRATLAGQAALVAEALEEAQPGQRTALLTRAGAMTGLRLRLYDARGERRIDSWQSSPPTYVLRDPAQEPWERHAARFLDRLIDRVVGAESYPAFREPVVDRVEAWPELQTASRQKGLVTQVRSAPDRTPLISVAVPVRLATDHALLATSNARDIVRIVRAERLRLGIVLGFVSILSVLLSLFLARTIVTPLRRLARAAHRVKQGRAREVQVPRLPSRSDEIGLLARAVSDMSLALRQRIDATEAFAADVAHELKNPLASLRSAVDSLERVKEPELQARLVSVIHDDVIRLDRLITDISEASRLDAELSRARFEPIDMGEMIRNLVNAREERGQNGSVKLAFARPRKGSTMVNGEGSRLARAIENLLSNAISFSPPDGLVTISASRVEGDVLIRIEDEGPGVPEKARELIFERFHSLRPEGEDFGKHSGLGLAIARTIVIGHGGTISVHDRDDGSRGACFIIRLPAPAPVSA